jgi:hypothetical protein
MIWWGHGSSAVVVVVLLATFVLRAIASRRRPAGGGQASRFGPPGRGTPFPGPGGTPGGGPPSAPVPGAGADGPTDDPGITHVTTGAGPGAGTAAYRPGFTGIPAGWLPDPSGRHERRYWSGTGWTEHVTSGGVPGNDPPPDAPGAGYRAAG